MLVIRLNLKHQDIQISVTLLQQDDDVCRMRTERKNVFTFALNKFFMLFSQPLKCIVMRYIEECEKEEES